MSDKTGRPTALKIPSPWSGDEHDPTGPAYWAWFWLYKLTRRLRHRIGLHDWQQTIGGRYCTWCGHRRRKS